MNQLTLKYPALPIVQPKHDQDELYESNRFDIYHEGKSIFDICMLHSNEYLSKYQNPLDSLQKAKRSRDEHMKRLEQEGYHGEGMEEGLKTALTEMTKKSDLEIMVLQKPAEDYSNLSDEEMNLSDSSNRIAFESKSRAYFQVAIDEAKTVKDFIAAAKFAEKLFDENLIVLKLFQEAIFLLKKEESVQEDLWIVEMIRESSLGEVEQIELMATLSST